MRATLSRQFKVEPGEDLVVALSGDFELNLEVVDKEKKEKQKCVVNRKKQGHSRHKPCGLQNKTDNCFLNSVLQCLSATHQLVSFVLATTSERGCDCLCCDLRDHFNETTKKKPFYPQKIFDRLGTLGEDFRGTHMHHDAEECLSLLLENIKETHECNKIIDDLFHCTTRVKEVCDSCDYKSSPKDELSFPLRVAMPSNASNSSLEDCLTQHFKCPMPHNCARCKGGLFRETSIVAAPKILVVHLLRFEFESGGRKIETIVGLPRELDLNSYMSPSDGNALYDLYGVIVHSEISRKTGHYVSYVKACDESWYSCNDDNITPFEGSISELEGYILFYRKRNEHQQEQVDEHQWEEEQEEEEERHFDASEEEDNDSGACPFQKDDEGQSPFRIAAMLNDRESLILNEKEDDAEFRNTLHVALKYGARQCVDYLLKKPANFNSQDDEGQTSLHIAAMLNDTHSLSALIEKEGCVDVINSQNGTPLHVALKYGAEECAKYLLEKGANCNLQDNDGDTAFHIAIRRANNNLDLLDKMLELDTSRSALNVKNHRCETFEDLLKRVPQKWISQELMVKLKDRGVNVQEKNSLEEELEAYLNIAEKNAIQLKVDGLKDAILAGGKNWEVCTLIITEGKSATNFATDAIKFVGEDKYGVYSLNGKIKNLQSFERVEDKPQYKHIKNIFMALGLTYDISSNAYVFDVKKLRYANVLMMLDQDSDGDHIRGLLINMFYRLCPQLLQQPFFLQDFVTCPYKATHIQTKVTFTFGRLEYQRWSQRWRSLKTRSDWSIYYFKGLQSYSVKEIEEYCEKFKDHIRYFVWSGDMDANYIDKAFSDNSSNDRKEWIVGYENGVHEGLSDTIGNFRTKTVSYAEFIKQDLVPYFVEDTKRHIPNLMDGLNITPRKVMHYFFHIYKVNPPQPIKIGDLASEVSSSCVYQHRETSLARSIFLMARDYCGTNNLNLLEPHGNFGSRKNGGKDIQEFHYLKVAISSIADIVFPKEDYPCLTFLEEEGKSVQPKWYAPIFPLILVNGSGGFACGFKAKVLTYNLKDVIENLKSLMRGEQLVEMKPYSRDFEGSVTETKGKKNSYTITGKWSVDNTRTILTIFEIPFTIWYDTYEKHLESLREKGTIQKYEKDSPANVHCYKVTLSKALAGEDLNGQERKHFKLEDTVHSSMLLYDPQGCLEYYSSPIEVLQVFYHERLEIYKKREAAMKSSNPTETAIQLWMEELRIFQQKWEEVCSGRKTVL